MTEIKICTCGKKIKIPIERIEDLEHLMNTHHGKFRLEKSENWSEKEQWMTQVFYLPDSTWKK